jgi:hypothetical protein
MENVKYTVIELNRETKKKEGTLFLLENRDYLGFRMIFKVLLDQILSNFYTMLWTIKYRISSITMYFTFTVPVLNGQQHCVKV